MIAEIITLILFFMTILTLLAEDYEMYKLVWVLFMFSLIPTAILSKTKWGKRRSNMKKGAWAEKKVGKRLKKIFRSKRDGSIVLNDLLLPVKMPNGMEDTTQIDHLVISPSGVIVVETKNMPGEIWGNLEDKNWKYKIGKNEHFLYNPLLQNKNHIRAVDTLIKERLHRDIPYFNVVVFKDSDTKVNVPDYNYNYGTSYMIKYKHLKDFFKEDMFDRQAIDPDEIYNILKDYIITGRNAAKKHRQKLEMKYLK